MYEQVVALAAESRSQMVCILTFLRSNFSSFVTLLVETEETLACLNGFKYELGERIA